MRRAALMISLAVILAAVGGAQSSPATPPPAARPQPPQLCDARTLTYLIGKPKSAIPVAADLSHRRVACVTCPMTEPADPTRTDILFDAQTGVITALTCG